MYLARITVGKGACCQVEDFSSIPKSLTAACP